MGQTFWFRYSGVVELISVVGPFVHVDHLPVGYQGINGHKRDFTALALG